MWRKAVVVRTRAFATRSTPPFEVRGALTQVVATARSFRAHGTLALSHTVLA